MPRLIPVSTFSFFLSLASWSQAAPTPPAPNGLEIPADYSSWQVISVSHRLDHHSMRAILGNDIAVAAARSGQINPWPDGE